MASSINVPSAAGAGGFPERGKTHPERGYLGGSNARDVSGGAALYRNEIANPDQVQHHNIRQFASHLLFDVARPTCATALHQFLFLYSQLHMTNYYCNHRLTVACMFAGSQASAIARAGALLRRTMQASEGLVVLSAPPPVISSHSLYLAPSRRVAFARCISRPRSDKRGQAQFDALASGTAREPSGVSSDNPPISGNKGGAAASTKAVSTLEAELELVNKRLAHLRKIQSSGSEHMHASYHSITIPHKISMRAYPHLQQHLFVLLRLK